MRFVLALLATSAFAAEPPFRVMRVLLFNLDRGIQAACSCKIHGVSVAQWSSYPDTSQWRIDWAQGVTDQQKALGRAFLENLADATVELSAKLGRPLLGG